MLTFEVNDPRDAIFLDPKASTDPVRWHEIAAELRRDEPVYRVSHELISPFYALTRHEDVFEVSRRNDIWNNTRHSVLMPDIQQQLLDGMGFTPHTLVHMDGHEHTEHRKVTNDWFKPAAVKGRQDAIDAIADEYVAKLADFGGECDFAQDIAVPYTLHVIMEIFGVPREDEAKMLELTQGMFGAADPEFMGDLADPFQAVVGTINDFQAYFNELSDERRKCPTEDLATVIANGQVDGCPLGETAELWYYIIVATAGHDTTSYGMSGGLAALLQHPDQVAKLQADPSLALNATEEMIRWTSPVRQFLRYAQQDTEIGGVEINEGERVLLSYPAANRDETVFDNAAEFDITRDDADKLISFGVGAHYCLGSQFARREIRTMLPKVMEAVDSVELADEPRYAEANFVGGVKHLPISYTMR
ncbi:MAG: cytochrome P450 [Actinomycetia bacterium]|nr:cytochrome P450 [Actinomycetes bacterium]